MAATGLLKRKRLLTERQEALLAELRAILNKLASTMERLDTDVTPADRRAFKDTLDHLDELFLLVIVGEFNSGKSTFINALLGAPIQPEGVTPTTDRITLLRYGDEPDEELREAFLIERTYPANVLRQITIVDTPGTNAVIRRHEELTQGFIPRADLVLFTTSADRPFTESERAFMEVIKEWGKKIVLVMNKADILESDEEAAQVMDFVQTHAQELLGTRPEIFAVSSRRALRARSSNNGSVDTEQWQSSGIGEIEHYIIETLDEETRVRLKLLSPLGVAERLSHTYLTAVEERLAVLHEDFATLDNIDRQLALFNEDLTTDVQYHLTDIDNVLRDMEERGLQFFDETLRLARTGDLLRRDKLREEFEREVVGDVGQQIEHRIQELIDWSVEKNLRLWQNVTDYISRRRAPQYSEGIIGEVGGAFDYNRNALIESVGNTARQTVESYDRRYESQMLAADVQSSLTNSAITGAAGISIGTALVALFSSVWLDVTGILVATMAIAGGLFILPAKRRQAKKEFSDRIKAMRTQVHDAVEQQFYKETEQSLGRIREAIGPYTRFVRTKREQLGELQRDLSDVEVALEKLRAEIS